MQHPLQTNSPCLLECRPARGLLLDEGMDINGRQLIGFEWVEALRAADELGEALYSLGRALGIAR